jgi:hypothetical protein
MLGHCCLLCTRLEFKVWTPNLVFTSTSTSTSTESAFSARIGVPVSQSGRIPQPQESTTTSGRAQRDNATAGSEANPFKFAKDDPERAPILRILEQGGYNLNTKSIFNDETLALLPKWSKVQQLYGPPKIIGLEKCKEFQLKTPLKDQTMGIAGMFNSGTNLLTDLLTINCINKESPASIQQQVRIKSKGKHLPPSLRGNRRKTLTVVTVRDPYTWMQSMCRQNYAAQFEHSMEFCPNIIPYKEDIAAHPRFAKVKYMPVNVKYADDLKVKHESLVHYWNLWYTEYAEAKFPRLLLRMEDLLFHGEEVTRQICECGGGTMRTPFKHISEVANHNSGIEQNHTLAGLIGSLIKYGNTTTRMKGYPPFQLQAARDLLDSRLMKLFGYPYVKVPSSSSSTIVEEAADKFL